MIAMLYRDTVHLLLQRSPYFDPEDVVVLLTAPTGVAAFNISGMTIHSALAFNTYSDKMASSKKKTLSLVLKGLKVLIIDEISIDSNNKEYTKPNKPIDSVLIEKSDISIGKPRRKNNVISISE